MANIFNLTNLKKTYYYLKRNGVMQTIGAALERVQAPYFADYMYVLPTESILEAQKQKHWKNQVTFSIVVPAYETKEEFVAAYGEDLIRISVLQELVLDFLTENAVVTEAAPETEGVVESAETETEA